MKTDNDSIITDLLSGYDAEIFSRALHLRDVILETLPGIIEQPDLPARMIAYCYGQKYSEMICSIIPSKKGLKLGFYKGPDLPDPEGILQGNGKISRYVVIRSDEQIKSTSIRELLENARKAYEMRVKK